MMLMLVIVAAVLGATVLQRQERRHRFELRWEYERHGMPIPVTPPKIPVLEALLTIVLGVIIGTFGGVLLRMVLGSAATPDMSEQEYAAAFFLSVGVALIILGIRAVRQNVVYRKIMISSG